MDGRFVSTGAAFNLALEPGYDSIELINITQLNLTAQANTNIMYARGTSLMSAGNAYLNLKTNNMDIWDATTFIQTNGFTFFDAGNPIQFPQIAVTAVTGASPAQVTAAAHGLAVGDTVRLTSLNGTMGSMNGLDFTVNSIVDPNNFTITFDASAGAISGTPATAGFMIKIIPNYFAPRNVVIGPTAITSTAGGDLLLNMNTVPSLNQGPSQYSPFLRPYQPGAFLRFYVPKAPQAFNLPQTANFLLTQIVQINSLGGAYAFNSQLQLKILQTGQQPGAITSATGLPALVYPAGGATYKSSFPFVTDIAESATILSEAEDNTGIRGVTIGTGVQSSGDLYQWIARQGYAL